MIQNTYLAILCDLFGVVPDLFPMGTLPRAGYYPCLNQGIERIEALPDLLPWQGLISQVSREVQFSRFFGDHQHLEPLFPIPIPIGSMGRTVFLATSYGIGSKCNLRKFSPPYDVQHVSLLDDPISKKDEQKIVQPLLLLGG